MSTDSRSVAGGAPAIGHQQMEGRVPVCQGAVGLDREARLTHGRADERGDGARGNPSEVAKQGAVVEQVRPEPLGYREHHLPVWYVHEQGLLQPQTPLSPPLSRIATPIERELGAGGMATVHLDEDLKHDREVAVKVAASRLVGGWWVACRGRSFVVCGLRSRVSLSRAQC